MSLVIDFYKKEYKKINKPRNDIYIGGPITSGGVIRLLWSGENTLIKDKNDVAKINIMLGSIAVQQIKESLKSNSTIYTPFELNFPDVNKWKESDFNLYFMFYLSGIEPEKAFVFYSEVQSGKIIDLDLFNQPNDRIIKLKSYLELCSAFSKWLKDKSIHYMPIPQILLLPDHHLSLGCTIEKEFGKSLGTQVDEVTFDFNHKDFKTSIANNQYWKAIRDKDFRIPIEHGNGKTLIILKRLT